MRVLPEDRGVQLPQLNSEIVWTGETSKTTVYFCSVGVDGLGPWSFTESS